MGNLFGVALRTAALALPCTFFCTLSAAAPASVTITGNLQSEAGCAADDAPDCALTTMTKSGIDGIWRIPLSLPAGDYRYFAAYDGAFDETYGLHGRSGAVPVPLSLVVGESVHFYFDDATHWLTDNVNSVIAVLAGDFQSELGCPADFSPGCMRSWLEDLDGDGLYTFVANLPDGAYSTVVAIDESFDESHGAPSGGNYQFVVVGEPVMFTYNGSTHALTIDTGSPVPELQTWAMMICGFALCLGLRWRRKLPLGPSPARAIGSAGPLGRLSASAISV